MTGASREMITLIGAGPVGSLLALHLAKRGYDVEIFERRPDMRREKVAAGRSINLALSTRGLKALHAVGLEQDILRHAVPMRGRMMHARTGDLTFQPYGRDDSEFINSVSRGGLNQLLMTRAEETGRVKIHFNSRVSAVTLPSGEITVHDEKSGVARRHPTGRLMGTDGSASTLRAEFLKRPGYSGTQEALDYGYKELTIPAGSSSVPFRIQMNALHIWPRGSFMTIALPNEDGSFTCTLFLPQTGTPSFESLTTPCEVGDFFGAQFPDLTTLIPDLTEAFFANPTGVMVTVKTGPWYFEDRALLLGDASHAIVPFFGQGMNSGFEDCTVLDSLIDRHAGNWEQIFADFYESRKPNTDAIADMAIDNFVEMRDKVADPRFLLEKEVEKRLMLEFPGEYVSRYGLVTFSDTPYQTARVAGLIQAEILREICRDVTRADEVDLRLAGALIRQKLTPFLKPHRTHAGS